MRRKETVKVMIDGLNEQWSSGQIAGAYWKGYRSALRWVLNE